MEESADSGAERSARQPPDAAATVETRVAASTPTPGDRVPASLAPGTRIGRYEILEPLGVGGMGVVYRARDPELDRTIALKLVRMRAGRSHAGARERLLREAQALARLAHPNVIAVYDVGEYKGSLFLATELVDGLSLSAWRDAAPRSWREIARVFGQAGRGLAAAHAAGLVHRDFKPSNAIVGADGRVRVLDFGLVRSALADRQVGDASAPTPNDPDANGANGASGASDANDANGASGASDANDANGASDANGANGANGANDANDARPARRTTGSFDSPLTVAGTVMGTPRYMAPEQHAGLAAGPAADQFAFCAALWEAFHGATPGDAGTPETLRARLAPQRLRAARSQVPMPRHIRRLLERGLRFEPGARWPSMQALLGELARNPGAARRRAAAAIAVVLLIAGVAFGAWRDPRAATLCTGGDSRLAAVWDDARRAELRAAFAAVGAAAAAPLAATERALDTYAARIAALDGEICAATRIRGDQSEELLDLRMACLDRRTAELHSRIEVLIAADAAVAQRAAATVPEPTELDACSDREALLTGVRLPPDPAARDAIAAATAEVDRARALLDAGKLADGATASERALRAVEPTGYRPLLAEARYLRGDALIETGAYAEAQVALLAATDDAEAGHRDELAAQVWIRLAWLRSDKLADPDAAGGALRRARAKLDRIGKRPVLEGRLHHGYALVAFTRGAFADTRQHAEAARDTLRELADESADMAEAENMLGDAYFAEGALDEAQAHYQRALAIWQAIYGPTHPRVANELMNLGAVAAVGGHQQQAMDAFRRALALWETALGPDNPETAMALFNLANAAMELGRLDEALAYAERALRVERAALGEQHPFVAMDLTTVGGIQFERGELGAAREHIEAAVAIQGEALAADHPDRAYPLLWLAEIDLAQGRPAPAHAALEDALPLIESASRDPMAAPWCRFLLGRARWELGEARGDALAAARAARDQLAASGERAKRNLAAADAWLAARRTTR